MNASDGSGQINLTSNPATDRMAAWSPDGSRIAFRSTRDANNEIYVMNASPGSPQTNLTKHPGGDVEPAWSPDGTRIAFTSSRDGSDDIHVMNADGSSPTRLTTLADTEDDPDWQAAKLKQVSLRAKPRTVEKGEKTRLTATVSPCSGHQGDIVEFYRKTKLIATKTSDDACVAKVRVKVTKTSRFTAVSPEQDVDHLAGTSNRVKVKVVHA